MTFEGKKKAHQPSSESSKSDSESSINVPDRNHIHLFGDLCPLTSSQWNQHRAHDQEWSVLCGGVQPCGQLLLSARLSKWSRMNVCEEEPETKDGGGGQVRPLAGCLTAKVEPSGEERARIQGPAGLTERSGGGLRGAWQHLESMTFQLSVQLQIFECASQSARLSIKRSNYMAQEAT